MKFALASLAAVTASLAACAEYYPPPPPPGPVAMMAPGALPPPMCFRTSDIRNHTVGDDSTLYINVSGRAVYRVEMAGACLAGATSSDPLVMRLPPGSPVACRPIDLDISISKGGIASPCIVRSLTAMTPDQVAALPPRMRP